MRSLQLKIYNFFFQEIDSRHISLFRIVIYLNAIIFLFDHSYALSNETYMHPWRPVGIFKALPRALTDAELYLIHVFWKISIIFSLIGLKTQFFTKLSFVTGLFVLGYQYNFSNLYHGLHLYIMTLGVLAFSDSGKALSVDSLLSKTKPHKSWKYCWPLRAIQVYTVSIFFYSGLEKVSYSGLSWALSDNFYLITFLNPGISPFAENLLKLGPEIFSALSIFVLLVIELLSPLALLHWQLSVLYVFLWISFHIGITLIFQDHLSFYSQFPCFMAFLIPLIPLNKISYIFNKRIILIK